MDFSLANNAIQSATQVRKKNIFLKLLVAFFVLVINIDTVSYLLLQRDDLIVFYQKTLFVIVLIVSAFSFFKWKRPDRFCFLIFLGLLLKLVIESLVTYKSVLAYPSVLGVISPFLYVYFIKNAFKKINIDILGVLIWSIFLGYFIFMLFYGHDFDFSNTFLEQETGPFSGDTRILHANSILLIVLPFLFFLNKIISRRKNYFSIAGFVICLIIILIHQHRTVWLTAIFSSLLLFSLKVNLKNMLRKLLLFTLLITGIFALLFVTIPGFKQLLIERFSDILDPLNEENTGGFRYLQILAYLAYFIQKPIFGWTFSGFELSNPFTSGVWEEGTGHHFHDAYIEVLFYFGITGLLLKFYPLYSVAKKIKRQLSDKSKILAAFSISGFLYCFSYVPTVIFWGIVGLCLYYIERDLKNSYEPVKENNG